MWKARLSRRGNSALQQVSLPRPKIQSYIWEFYSTHWHFRCKTTWYCSATCSEMFWSEHKATCSQDKERRRKKRQLRDQKVSEVDWRPGFFIFVPWYDVEEALSAIHLQEDKINSLLTNADTTHILIDEWVGMFSQQSCFQRTRGFPCTAKALTSVQ